MFLLIPVYREQSIIHQTVRQFQQFSERRSWLHIIFITSIREDQYDQELTTHQILENLIMSSCDHKIRLIKCNNPNGVMAHQLNYAIELLLKDEKQPFYIGIYNADSILSLVTIDYAYRELGKNEKKVLQQYAIYPTEYIQDFNGKILSHIAGWQTRWSLHFELGRLLIDNNFYKNISYRIPILNLIRPFHYTIGHGLFFTSKTYILTTGFAEDEINEDAQFGLMLYFLNCRIEPIPYLEVAVPPPSLSVYFKQQSVWFNGPIYAFKYAIKLFNGSKGKHAERPKVENWTEKLSVGVATIKLFTHSLYWILGPPSILFLTIWIFIRQPIIYWVVWLVLVFYFVWGLNWISHNIAKKHSDLYIIRSKVNLSRYPFSAFIAYLFHCIGPFICLYKILILQNKLSNKYKTERQ